MPATVEPRSSPPKALEDGPQAALLSYLVPGLGQMYQGRIGKGILFLLSIYALFFYGNWLSSGTIRVNDKDYYVPGNVYLPHTAQGNNTWPELVVDLYNHPHFLGQFWVGIVTWPAIWQYWAYDSAREDDPPLRGFERQPREDVLQVLETQGGTGEPEKARPLLTSAGSSP